jgi:D-alanine-D-alanine ligase
LSKERVAVIYNEPKHTDASEHWLARSNEAAVDESFRDESEYGVLEQMQSIAQALEGHGFSVTIFSADDDIKRLCDFLTTDRPDVIFNCCESISGKASLEMNIAAVYELLDIPYTGSGAMTLGIALNKSFSKDIFKSRGIPTPDFAVVEVGEHCDSGRLHFPLIVKPAKEDASIGIDAASIVYDSIQLDARVTFVHREFDQAAIVEEYIEGRELNVGVIGNEERMETLPISEIRFDTLPDDLPKIVTYEAKWVESSPYYAATVPECPAQVSESVANDAKKIAIDASRAIGLRGYGRIDMRLRASDNKLFVLEANPNPDISEDAGFMRAARVSGRGYDGTINEILQLALASSIKERSHNSSSIT